MPGTRRFQRLLAVVIAFGALLVLGGERTAHALCSSGTPCDHAVLLVPSSAATSVVPASNGIIVLMTWSRGAPRFGGDGAPVSIQTAGGWSAGGGAFNDFGAGDYGLADYGVIDLRYLLPAGSGNVGSTQYTSGGTYDYRRSNCQQALVDVAAFAHGTTRARVLASSNAALVGKTTKIARLAGYPVQTDNIALVGYSNGGNLVIQALARNTLPGVASALFYESPTLALVQLMELGTPALGNGENPAYAAHTCRGGTCRIDVSNVIFDQGNLQTVDDADSASGEKLTDVPVVCYDADSDRRCGASERVVSLNAVKIGGALKVIMSPEVRSARGLARLPSTLFATETENSDYFAEAQASVTVGSTPAYFYATALSKNPGLAVMELARQTDHGSEAEDHPHVKTNLENFLRYHPSMFARLNPDRAYLCAALGYPAYEMRTMLGGGFTDHDAGRSWSWAEWDPANDLIPNTIRVKDLVSAGVLEMVDRKHTGNWDANLTDPAKGSCWTLY